MRLETERDLLLLSSDFDGIALCMVLEADGVAASFTARDAAKSVDSTPQEFGSLRWHFR